MIVPGALLAAPGGVAERGAQHGYVVHTAMLVEALVLGGEDRLAHDVGHILDLNQRPPLLAELAQKLSFRGDDS